MKLFRQIKPDKSTAFRLPNGLLTTVDIICEKQDITRSQLYRRSLMEYIKNQPRRDARTKANLVGDTLRATSMIGEKGSLRSLRMSQLQEELRNASFDKLKIFENVSSVQAIDSYIRQNRQLVHDVIIVSSKK